MDGLSIPLVNQIFLLIAPHAGKSMMLEMAARLAVAGALRVIDGGNQFNAYVVARSVRRRTARMEEALTNIRVARAFTCYQMLVMLADTPENNHPTLVLDLLSTFYDENVRLAESRRLLTAAIDHLRRLSEQAPLMVSVRPLPSVSDPERAELLEMLRQAAHQVWITEPPVPLALPSLF
ncbi:MAG: hypothetical protein AB9891_08500 [Anaerolineaceae bacterium]